MGTIPKQTTLDLKRRVVKTAQGFPGSPRLATLQRVPAPSREALARLRNAKRRSGPEWADPSPFAPFPERA